MKKVLCVLLIVALYHGVHLQNRFKEDLEDNEFAEFEDFEEEDDANEIVDKTSSESVHASKSKPIDDDSSNDDAVVEDEDIEFDHFQDEEEFEGFETGPLKTEEKEAPKITITKVPLHLRTNWDSYYLEMLILTGLLVYFLNFFTGKNKNKKLAHLWFQTHRTLLEDNFSLVGDDMKMEVETQGLVKEAENTFLLWCSGRTCCEGMLVELKFLKRQDLLSVMTNIVRPSFDQVLITVEMNKDDMDSFVFCLATKKSAARLAKDMADLSVYCPERRSGEKLGVPARFQVMSELLEATSAILDARTLAILNKLPEALEYIHVSDQFSGPKQTEETTLTKLPDVKKVVIFCWNIPMKGMTSHDAIEATRPLLQLVFYTMDKIKRFRLTKEAKAKADKNRLRVEEAFLKTTHAARAEAAAARREEKKRQEKERILQEDPEKQRKWEDKEMKRQMKRKAPKMKQLKVKAL